MKSTSPYIATFEETITLNDNQLADIDGKIIEDFDYPINLMIACSAKIITGGFEDVLKFLSK